MKKISRKPKISDYNLFPRHSCEYSYARVIQITKKRKKRKSWARFRIIGSENCSRINELGGETSFPLVLLDIATQQHLRNKSDSKLGEGKVTSRRLTLTRLKFFHPRDSFRPTPRCPFEFVRGGRGIVGTSCARATKVLVNRSAARDKTNAFLELGRRLPHTPRVWGGGEGRGRHEQVSRIYRAPQTDVTRVM